MLILSRLEQLRAVYDAVLDHSKLTIARLRCFFSYHVSWSLPCNVELRHAFGAAALFSSARLLPLTAVLTSTRRVSLKTKHMTVYLVANAALLPIFEVTVVVEITHIDFTKLSCRGSARS